MSGLLNPRSGTSRGFIRAWSLRIIVTAINSSVIGNHRQHGNLAVDMSIHGTDLDFRPGILAKGNLRSFHGVAIFAMKCGMVVVRAMAQCVLRRQNVSFLALPDIQGRLLDCTGKRKHQWPR